MNAYSSQFAEIQLNQPNTSPSMDNLTSLAPIVEGSIAVVFAVFLLHKTWSMIEKQFVLINNLVEKLDDENEVK